MLVTSSSPKSTVFYFCANSNFTSSASSSVSRAFEEKEPPSSTKYSPCQQLHHQSTLHILDSFRIIELVASSSTPLCPKTQISIVLSSESQLAIGNQRDTSSPSSRHSESTLHAHQAKSHHQIPNPNHRSTKSSNSVFIRKFRNSLPAPPITGPLIVILLEKICCAH